MTPQGRRQVAGFVVLLFVLLVMTGQCTNSVDEACVEKYSAAGVPVVLCDK